MEPTHKQHKRKAGNSRVDKRRKSEAKRLQGKVTSVARPWLTHLLLGAYGKWQNKSDIEKGGGKTTFYSNHLELY